MDIKLVEIKKKEEHNVIIGTAHFIKTVEDLHEALVSSVPGIKFGLAFCEASQKRLVRHSGTDEELERLAIENAERIGAGHTFVIILGNAYPINVMKDIKAVDEIVNIHCATANPLKVVVAEEGEQRAVLGVMDGLTPIGVEGLEDINDRKTFLRRIGYKQ